MTDKAKTQKHPGGRPTKLCPEILSKAQEYVEQWSYLGDAIPMLAGLCVHIGIAKETMQRWEAIGLSKEQRENEIHKNECELYSQFSAICARVRVMQERVLINKGLTKESEASLSKVLLFKHGYSDRQEIDHTTAGESFNRPDQEAVNAAKAEIRAELGLG